MATEGGAGRKPVKGADAPMSQSREALLAAWPLYPEGARRRPHEGCRLGQPAGVAEAYSPGVRASAARAASP
jgi:hypothetical protein